MTREKILEKAVEVLPRYGVKSVTMDDLAQRLSMSKKTIYQHFKDKSALVEAVVERVAFIQDQQFELIKEKSQDAIEEMYLVSVFVREFLSAMDASVIFDLQKYYPKAYEKFNCHKDDKVYSSIKENLEEGVKQGFYRKEINTDILTKLKILEMEGSFNPEVFSPSQYQLIDVQMELFDHFLFGILSPKGFEMLTIYKEKYQVK